MNLGGNEERTRPLLITNNVQSFCLKMDTDYEFFNKSLPPQRDGILLHALTMIPHVAQVSYWVCIRNISENTKYWGNRLNLMKQGV